jgi:hypothetical protein
MIDQTNYGKKLSSGDAGLKREGWSGGGLCGTTRSQAANQNHVATYIDRLEGECIHILDVGAEPLTKLGKVHVSKQM